MKRNKTVWILLRSHIVGLPPIMTVLKCLLESNLYQVNFVSTQSSGINHNNLREYIYPQAHNVSIFKKMLNYVQYRNFVQEVFTKYIDSKDIVWLGSLDTALACKGLGFFSINKYILHLHELYDTHPKKLKAIKLIAQNAKHVVVPEINRAGILQVWLSLKERPTVLPNKPYYHPRVAKLVATHEVAKEILIKFKTNKPIILYQGHISGDRNLMPIAMAMQDLSNYEFWLLGVDHGYVDQLLEVSKNIKYLGSVPAPYHLEITSHATIGIMSYDLVTLNNLYCAPNKVWEYSGFGVPFITNECLSLTELFIRKVGVCTSWDKEGIKRSVDLLEKNSNLYRENANNFFDSINLVEIITSLVC